MLRSYYQPIDFDFAIIYIAVKHIFYVLPVEIFIGFRGSISFLEYGNKQRKAVSENYREAFDLISQWAAAKEISS